MKESIEHIQQYLKEVYGLDVSKYDDVFLNKSLQKRVAETKCATIEEYYSLLDKSTLEAKILIDSLQNSYTDFFRNALTFSVLEQIVLPGLILQQNNKATKELRVWSAACASGQEPYSIAILLEELKSTCNLNYRIFATDISPDKVEEARTGKFSADSLNNMTIKRAKRWFEKTGDTYTVKPELKESISFSVFDLFDKNLSSPPDSIFGHFDLVFCANLLFYYKSTFRETILNKTSKALAHGGFLVAGEAEREILINYNYRELYPQAAIFQKNK